MYKTEAFLRTVFFLGTILFILWIIQGHSAEYGLFIRPLYQVLVVLFAVAFSPLFYKLSLKHLSQKQYTRDDYLTDAIVSGCLALGFIVFAALNFDGHRTVAGRWLAPAVWTIATAVSLFMASKAKKTRYIQNE
jgi:hypothetical protein